MKWKCPIMKVKEGALLLQEEAGPQCQLACAEFVRNMIERSSCSGIMR
jgi:hypothetical protein